MVNDTNTSKKETLKTAGRTIWNFCTTGFMPAVIIAFVVGTVILIVGLAK